MPREKKGWLRVTGFAFFVITASACDVLRMYGVSKRLYLVGQRIWPSKRAELLSHLGLVYSKTGDVERGIACLAEAMTLNPEDAIHHVRSAWVYEDNGKIESAIEHYQKALDMDSEFSDSIRQQVVTRLQQLKAKL